MTVVNQGVQINALELAPTGAGSKSRELIIQSDSILVTLYAGSVAGTLDVVVYAQDGRPGGNETELFRFPQLTAGTTELLLRRAAISTANVRIAATYSDACDFKVQARAINGGLESVKIVGSANLQTSQLTIGTTPAILIPSALEDRIGVVIKNWSTGTDVYIGESAAKAVPGTGYPLAGRDAVAIDVAAGSTIYASTATGTADVRIAETGG